MSNSLSQVALKKFKKNRSGLFSLYFIILVGITAILAYILAPDNSQNANQMHLEIHSKKPGFKVQILSIPSAQQSNESFIKTLLFGQKNTVDEIPISGYRITDEFLEIRLYTNEGLESREKSYPLSLFEGNPKDYIKTKKFLLGTDKYGRDLLSRMLVGARISFFIGFIAVFISLVIGITVGAIAGYFGGKLDNIIMWVINITWSIPTLLLVIAITLALGKGFWQVFIAVGLTMWVEVARVVRGQVMSVKEQQYVELLRH